eukprot:TRINITY_DN11384_c0_g1_i15.p1 TRINITY_DN11384_c0_g1~~TRINITY_DN11384_c0_g1_i15.p1  ORF type:complete len:563 (-),score=72.01 TRINITY_DN11384_c0_g1_i15:15-1703(-)
MVNSHQIIKIHNTTHNRDTTTGVGNLGKNLHPKITHRGVTTPNPPNKDILTLLPDVYIHARIGRWVEHWHQIGAPETILAWIKFGLSWSFDSNPIPQEYSSAIVSFLFCVPKKDGGWRPILNFVPTNNHISKIHFKMDTVKDLKDILMENDLMTKIDLKDAYLHLYFNKNFRKYCAFWWRGTVWQFISMMFGHVHAPRWWTKVMRVVVKYLRKLGIRCIIYIDDIIILHGTNREDAEKEINFVVNTLMDLGLTINMKKSILKPTTRVVFLGFIVDSVLMKMFIPGPKIKEIRKMAGKLIKEEKCTIRMLSSFLGKISAAAEAVLPWRLRTRALLLDKHKIFREKCSWESTVHLSQDSLSELRFWTDCVQNFNGKDIKTNHPDWITRSDSSGEGFGGTGPGWCLAGEWSAQQNQMHNNTLETLAACHTIWTFILQKKIEKGTILHQSDNMVAVSYLSKQGGKKQELSKAVQEVWELCLEKGIEIRAQHVPGDQMTKDCDFLSRMHKKQSEWMLPRETFLALERKWGPPYSALIPLLASSFLGTQKRKETIFEVISQMHPIPST